MGFAVVRFDANVARIDISQINVRTELERFAVIESGSGPFSDCESTAGLLALENL